MCSEFVVNLLSIGIVNILFIIISNWQWTNIEEWKKGKKWLKKSNYRCFPDNNRIVVAARNTEDWKEMTIASAIVIEIWLDQVLPNDGSLFHLTT